MIEVFPATPAHAADLARMSAAFGNDALTPGQQVARLDAARGLQTVLLAAVDGEIAGFAVLQLVPSVTFIGPFAELTDLYVESAFRRRGVARALVARVEALAHAAGAAEIWLVTGLKNEAAQSFYAALGYGNPAVCLRKRIGDQPGTPAAG